MTRPPNKSVDASGGSQWAKSKELRAKIKRNRAAALTPPFGRRDEHHRPSEQGLLWSEVLRRRDIGLDQLNSSKHCLCFMKFMAFQTVVDIQSNLQTR